MADQETGYIDCGDEQVAFSVVRSRRRTRTIAFKMNKDSSLSVSVPFAARIGAVVKILEKRASWIARERIRQRNRVPECDYRHGTLFTYLGYSYILHVSQGEHAPPLCRLTPHILWVHVPDTKLSTEGLRQEVRLEVLLWLKKRARTKLKKRLDLWAERMGVDYKKLMITDPQRRWGSCSVDNVIRLNWQLIKAPLPVLDYVVVHELAHIRHKNHSPRFWDCVAHMIPDYLARRKILRQIECRILS